MLKQQKHIKHATTGVFCTSEKSGHIQWIFGFSGFFCCLCRNPLKAKFAFSGYSDLVDYFAVPAEIH